MKFFKIYYVILHVLFTVANVASAQSDCGSATYIRRLGSVLSVERGLSLAYAPLENAIYVAGTKDDSLSIVKINAQDEFEWIRNFDIVPQKGDHPHKIIVDSEGMIVIAGTSGQFNVLGEVFALRYDPLSDIVIWAKRYLSYNNSFNHGLEELVPGSHFLISNNPSVPGNNDEQLLMLDRQTGDVIPESSFHIDLGDSDALNDLILHEGFLYGDGRYTDGPDFRDMRNTITKIDPNTGASIWTLLGHIPGNAIARLYGAGMVIDQGEIFSISVGDENGTSIDQTEIWVQKTTLDGEVRWMNKYDLPGTSDWVDEIIASEGGFVVLARTRTAPGYLYLFKIDREGALIWAKRFDLAQKNFSLILGGIQSPLQQIGDHLYFTAFSEQGDDEDMVLVKTDLDGNVADSCGFVSEAEIVVTPVVNPFFYFVEPVVFDHNPEVISENAFAVNTTVIQVKDVCTTPGTIEHEIQKTICLGDEYAGYAKTGIYIDTFVNSAGCDSIRTLELFVTDCATLVQYNLNDCTSFMSDGSNMDYSEFVPAYISPLTCADISASIVFRDPPQENKHSCTPGLNGTEAMCISAISGCEYVPGDAASLVIEISVDPAIDSVFSWTGLEFYEKGPMLYNWISGPSGINNYPTLYGIRILRNGTEIFSEFDIPTSLNWTKQTYTFLGDSLFRVTEPAQFRIELLPYCPIGNGAVVSAWDIEDISILGGCLVPEQKKPVISGRVRLPNDQIYAGPQFALASNALFQGAELTNSSPDGIFIFDRLDEKRSYFIRGYNNEDADNGVSTADLIHIQKYLLGIESFSSPYQFIAGDADKNGRINVLDLLTLKRLLLGIYDQFPANTSWRFGFLPPGEVISDIQQFNEVYSIEVLSEDTTNVNVTAVKVGDVTGDAISKMTTTPVVTRTQRNLGISYQDQRLSPGMPVEVPIRFMDQELLEGMQMEFTFESGSIVGIVPNGKLLISQDDYHLNTEGSLKLIWHNSAPVSMNKNEVLFSLLLMPDRGGMLKDDFRLTTDDLIPEAYIPDQPVATQLSLLPQGIEAEKREILNSSVSPNPIHDRVIVSCEFPSEGNVVFQFVTLNGQVLVEQRGWYSAGRHQFDFARNELGAAEGLIYLQILTDSFVNTHKLMLAEN